MPSPSPQPAPPSPLWAELLKPRPELFAEPATQPEPEEEDGEPEQDAA